MYFTQWRYAAGFRGKWRERIVDTVKESLVRLSLSVDV